MAEVAQGRRIDVRTGDCRQSSGCGVRDKCVFDGLSVLAHIGGAGLSADALPRLSSTRGRVDQHCVPPALLPLVHILQQARLSRRSVRASES
jgi:hypothetical protein